MKKNDKSAKRIVIGRILDEMLGQHNAVAPDSAARGSEMESEIRYWIDSGSLLMNMILSNRPDGGWPCGRIVEVFGKESTGKSTLAYVAIANAQKAGGIGIYADLEKTGNPEFMKLLGVDLDNLLTTNIPEIEKLFTALERNLVTIIKSGAFTDKPVIVVIDSVTALTTDTETQGGYSYNMATALGKAKQLNAAIRKIIPFLSKANACLYFVNQIRDNVNPYGDNYVVTGGKSLAFFTSIRVYLEGRTKIVIKDQTLENAYKDAMAEYKRLGGKKAGIEAPEKPKDSKDNQTTIGYETTALTKKNKTCPAERRANFKIIFSQGLIDEDCWLEPCAKFGIISQSGSRYELVGFENNWSSFTKSEWAKRLQQSEEDYNKIKELLTEKLTINLEHNKAEAVEVAITADEDDYIVPVLNP